MEITPPKRVIPSGKRLHSYGNSPCFMGKLTIYTWPFSIAMLNYQRVLWMEKLLHLGCLLVTLKPWDYGIIMGCLPSTNWCRIPSINISSPGSSSFVLACYSIIVIATGFSVHVYTTRVPEIVEIAGAFASFNRVHVWLSTGTK